MNYINRYVVKASERMDRYRRHAVDRVLRASCFVLRAPRRTTDNLAQPIFNPAPHVDGKSIKPQRPQRLDRRTGSGGAGSGGDVFPPKIGRFLGCKFRSSLPATATPPSPKDGQPAFPTSLHKPRPITELSAPETIGLQRPRLIQQVNVMAHRGSNRHRPRRPPPRATPSLPRQRKHPRPTRAKAKGPVQDAGEELTCNYAAEEGDQRATLHDATPAAASWQGIVVSLSIASFVLRAS